MELISWIEWDDSASVPSGEQEKWETLFRSVMLQSLAEEKVEDDVEVELNVVDDEAIRQMNADYREIDRSTDVLSFPMCAFSAGHACEEMQEQDEDPETGCIPLGNIVLSWDHVKAQALEYGHSLEREAAFLTAHSMLHLLGYDHMTPEDEKRMFAKQEKILQTLGITREE